jgi:hypothetical protein
MLTKSEKEWMENRWKFSCWYCPNTPQVMCTMGERPAHCAIMDTDWQDAAEFSERVAAKLAKHTHDKPLVCEINWDCPYWPQGKCAWCYLKAARIEVEEEMDGKA